MDEDDPLARRPSSAAAPIQFSQLLTPDPAGAILSSRVMGPTLKDLP